MDIVIVCFKWIVNTWWSIPDQLHRFTRSCLRYEESEVCTIRHNYYFGIITFLLSTFFCYHFFILSTQECFYTSKFRTTEIKKFSYFISFFCIFQLFEFLISLTHLSLSFLPIYFSSELQTFTIHLNSFKEELLLLYFRKLLEIYSEIWKLLHLIWSKCNNITCTDNSDKHYR